MRFATLRVDGVEQAVLARGQNWIPLDLLDESLRGDLLTLLEQEPDPKRLEGLGQAADRLAVSGYQASATAPFCPPYRRPHKIWGIGLNYSDHATDLGETSPPQPASFIKGDHTIVGQKDKIVIPLESSRTTAEAELGLVIGRETRNVEEGDALDYVFGVCAVLDQTAEDILALNPRYLTRAKNFPTFFSFGPEVVTLDEFLAGRTMWSVSVATVVDGVEARQNVVGNMTHSPAGLVSFHSKMMPLYPGDIISTGTPGASALAPGMEVRASVSGLSPLINRVEAG